ncbi:MAG: helix-turn-helix transcriptional regulator [Clostridia bacterium]|nr:helix-turn-helix transcriptional regulator [Clostridia bacterium]
MYNNKMKKIRKEKGITLEKLASKTGISVGYLSHLERGTRENPTIIIMDKIAFALEKSVQEVFFDEK